MEKRNDGGSAFPVNAANLGKAGAYAPDPGMTLRDYLAAKALPCAWDAFDKGYWDCDTEDINRTVAECAYQMADAMIAAREK